MVIKWSPSDHQVTIKWPLSGHKVTIKWSPSGHKLLTRWYPNGTQVVMSYVIFILHAIFQSRKIKLHQFHFWSNEVGRLSRESVLQITWATLMSIFHVEVWTSPPSQYRSGKQKNTSCHLQYGIKLTIALCCYIGTTATFVFVIVVFDRSWWWRSSEWVDGGVHKGSQPGVQPEPGVPEVRRSRDLRKRFGKFALFFS